jgi:hypothetical protein
MAKARKPHAIKLSYESEFMESLPARPLRILAEYFDPMTRFKQENIADTIVIFGSARVPARDRAQKLLAAARRSARGRMTPEKRQRLHQAQRAVEMSKFYEDARHLAGRITEWSMTLGEKPRRFVVCSGGGPGIMEAANRGASEAGGKSVGLNIELPHEQAPNRYIPAELCINFHYFFMRKLWFSQLAKALIVFPGGFGTMDELWEMLTLAQTGKLSRHNLILIYGRSYWDDVLDWRAMVRWGVISESDFGLLQFADTVEEAFQRVKSTMEKHHMKLNGDWLDN